MPTVDELEETFQNQLIPITSKSEYELEWKRFNDFRSKNDLTGVTERVILAYCSSLRESGYAPTTCISRISKLKKMCLVKKCDVPESTWGLLKSWIDNIKKMYVPQKAEVFTYTEIEQYINAHPDTPVSLQEKVMLIMAFSGGLRLVEDYSLEWRDLVFKTNPTEISVTVRRTKGNAEGRYFLITKLKHLEIILKYRLSHLDSKQKDTGFLYRCWSTLGGKWSSTRRGRRWFQDIPKKVAKFLKKDEKGYTHHSLRRSMASQLHTNGATRLNIKYAGGWRSDTVVEGYVISSVGEKRRTANLVSCDVAVQDILPAKKNHLWLLRLWRLRTLLKLRSLLNHPLRHLQKKVL